MINTTTQNSILKYLYDETDPDESSQIEEDILKDPEKESYYIQMLEAFSLLDEVKLTPSNKVINAILSEVENYASPHSVN